MTCMSTPQQKNPCPWGHDIYNFDRPFLGHHYCILSLSDICMGVEQTILKQIMHFHFMTYIATPKHKNPALGYEIYIFDRPLLGHHYDKLGLFDLCQGVKKKIFTEIMHVHYMTYLATRTPALGVMKFTILIDLSLFIITIYFVCLINA